MHSTHADRLREERSRVGLSQSALAEACAVTRETWSRYESGKLTPGLDVLVALAQAGVDVLYILTGSRSFTPPDPLSPREAVLLDNYRHAAAAGQRAIESTAAALAAGIAPPAAAPPPRAAARDLHYHGPIENIAGRDIVSRNVTNQAAPPRRKRRPGP